MHPVATRQHRQGKARQGSTRKARHGKPRQHEPRAQMTYSESGRYLAEVVANRLGDRVVAQLWGGRAPLLVIPNHAMAVQSSFWNPFMVKKIEQGRKWAPSHTFKFLSL